MTDDNFTDTIMRMKDELKDELFILGHFYQRDEVLAFADAIGDSFQLSKLAAENKRAKFIVFCGVRFMAETAKILASEGQRVYLPDPLAGCPMAEMADISDVIGLWERMKSLGIKNPVPVAYVNSTSEIKAFCGANDGITCTSSSAEKILKWEIAKGSKVVFLPDRNLGLNIAMALGINESKIVTYDPNLSGGGLDDDEIARSDLILWNGFCHVHIIFKPQDVERARKEYPDCKVIVHPESDRSVVSISDAAGSTAFIKKYVEDAKEGSTIFIGTELSFVQRLARDNSKKSIFPLASSICPNMFRTGLDDLARTLENLGHGDEVFVDSKIKSDAKIALNRMLVL